MKIVLQVCFTDPLSLNATKIFEPLHNRVKNRTDQMMGELHFPLPEILNCWKLRKANVNVKYCSIGVEPALSVLEMRGIGGIEPLIKSLSGGVFCGKNGIRNRPLDAD